MHFLPITAHPIKHESIFGYLLRLSELNHYGGINWIAELVGIKDQTLNLSSFSRHLNDLSTITRQPVSSLQDICPLPTTSPNSRIEIPNVGIIPRYHIHSNVNICPQCIADHSFHPFLWHFKFVKGCPQHGLKLHSHCPKCKKQLSWSRPYFHRCNCGFDLRTIEPLKSSHSIKLLAILIAYHLKSFSNKPEELNNLPSHLIDTSLNHCLAIFTLIIKELAGTLETGKKSFDDIPTIELEKVMAQSIEIFKNWPQRFHNFIASICRDLESPDLRQCQNTHIGLHHALGRFYETIIEKPNYYNELKYELQVFLETPIGSLITPYRDYYHSEYTEYNKDWISLQEACRLLKVSKQSVKNLIYANLLVCKFLKQSTETIHKISVDSIDKYRKLSATWIDKTALIKRLGVSHHFVELLLNDKIIEAKRGPNIDFSPKWQISPETVTAFLYFIKIRLPRKQIELSDKLVSFNRAYILLSHRGVTGTKIIQLIKSGRIRPLAQDETRTGLDQFMFSVEDISKFHKSSSTINQSIFKTDQMNTMLTKSTSVNY